MDIGEGMRAERLDDSLSPLTVSGELMLLF